MNVCVCKFNNKFKSNLVWQLVYAILLCVNPEFGNKLCGNIGDINLFA